MKKRLAHISPLQCGIVLAALYFCLSLLIVPFFLLAALAGSHSAQYAQPGHPANPFAAFGVVFIILIPIFYTILGFIGGIIAALIYNLIARMTGGLEFITLDVPPAAPSPMSYSVN